MGLSKTACTHACIYVCMHVCMLCVHGGYLSRWGVREMYGLSTPVVELIRVLLWPTSRASSTWDNQRDPGHMGRFRGDYGIALLWALS